MQHETIDCSTVAWVKHNRSIQLVKIPQKRLIQFTAAALLFVATTISASLQSELLLALRQSNQKALHALERAATAKAKMLDKEFEDRLQFIHMARLKQAKNAMQQYASLNNKAYQLGFETFNRLKDIDKDLSIPIHQREAFKMGIDRGKRRYKLSLADRRLSQPPKIKEATDRYGKDLIEADKESNNGEIKLNFSDTEQ